MGAKDSRRDGPPFTERGYWLWRDDLESGLAGAAPDRAPTVVEPARIWYAGFLRARRRALIRRSAGQISWATIVAAALVTLCAVAGVRWHEQIWVIAVCALGAALVLYRYVSTLAAARAAHGLEHRTLARQFPPPDTFLAEAARKHA